MEVYTTEPGLQFYDDSYLSGSHPPLDGRPHFAHAGLCLEPGRFRSQSSEFRCAGTATRRSLPADDGVPLRQRGLMCPLDTCGPHLPIKRRAEQRIIATAVRIALRRTARLVRGIDVCLAR
jgi:hypothetical protein